MGVHSMHTINKNKRQEASATTATIRPDPEIGSLQPLSVLVITAGDDMQPGADAIQRNMASASKESAVLRIDQDPTLSLHDQLGILESSIIALDEQGRIGPQTQVILNLHGGAENNSLVVGDEHGRVSVDALDLIDFLYENGNPKIHFLCCESGNLRDALAERPGTCFLHSGKKAVMKAHADDIMQEFCHFLCGRENPPGDDEIFEFLEQLTGENIAMAGQGKLAIHDTNTYQYLETGPDGKPEFLPLAKQKAERVFHAKLGHGSDTKVESMLGEVGDVLLSDYDRSISPMYLAAASSRDAETKLSRLITRGLDIDVLDNDRCSALHIACQYNDIDCARRLLSSGADPELPLPSGNTLLATAIAEGNLAMAGVLLEHRADPNGRADEYLLDPARETDSIDALQLLRTGRAVSLLELSITLDDQTDMTRLLLENGADPYQVMRDGGSLLELAICENKLQIMSLLLDSMPDRGTAKVTARDWDFCIYLIAKGHVDKEFLRPMIGASVRNESDAVEVAAICNTLMPIAIKHGATALANVFIVMGADDPAVQQRIKQRNSIEAAMVRRDPALLRAALGSGIPPDLKLSTGVAAFEWAILKGELEIAQALLMAGAKAQTDDTDKLLAAAMDQRDLASIKLLLRYRSDAGTQNLNSGVAPSLLRLAVLEIAAGRANIGLLEILSEDGEDIREGAGTPGNLVQLARDAQMPELARELIRLGATGKIGRVDQDAPRPGIVRTTLVKQFKAKS